MNCRKGTGLSQRHRDTEGGLQLRIRTEGLWIKSFNIQYPMFNVQFSSEERRGKGETTIFNIQQGIFNVQGGDESELKNS